MVSFGPLDISNALEEYQFDSKVEQSRNTRKSDRL